MSALDELTIDFNDVDPALRDLDQAWREELMTREAAFAALTAPILVENPNFNKEGPLDPGDPSRYIPADPPSFKPSAAALGTTRESGDSGYYGVWMDQGGIIHRWNTESLPGSFYTPDDIRSITPENRRGFIVEGVPGRATYEGKANGFAARTDETAGVMTADVDFTLTFGSQAASAIIDNPSTPDIDEARNAIPERNPIIDGTIDNFRLVGQSVELGWTATINGTLLDDGTVASGDIQTGKLPDVVTRPNALAVGFSTTQVTRRDENNMKSDPVTIKTAPPTHANGSFDLTFQNGQAVGAFDLERKTQGQLVQDSQ